MKNILKTLFALSLLFTVACDDVEPVMYNPNEGQTFLSFSSTYYTLPVTINSTGTLDVVLNSSTLSSVDRVYNVEIIADETNANPLTYSLPATVTIPANEHQGILTITGEDNGLVDGNAKQLVIRLSNVTDEAMDSNHVIIDIVEVCPLNAAFTGNYSVTQISALYPINGGQAMLGNNVVYSIGMGSSEYERVFRATPYPGISGAFPEVVVRFTLKCGSTVLANTVDTGNGCSDPNIEWRVATVQSTYNNDNDNTFQLTVTEDAASSCTTPRQTTIRFTKVN